MAARDAIRCTKRSKQTHQRCGLACVPGMDACHWHGGRSLRGLAHPVTKHGRYSKDLPTRLAADYHAALADPDLLSVRQQIAVQESRYLELLRRLREGDAGTIWPDLLKAKAAFGLARTTGDIPKMHATMATIEALIDHGQQDYALWRAIGEASDRLATLRLTEHKRLVDLKQVVTADKALLLVGMLTALVREIIVKYVEDDRTRRHIFGDLTHGIERHMASPVLAEPAFHG